MSKIKFEELNLSKELLKAVSSMGFEEMTPIQAEAIPAIILGEDIVGQASTGTGKTAAFGLPAIEKIDETLRAVQVIVLCPTRELAIQVSSEMNRFLKYKKNISALAVYGGQPIQRQLFGLRRGPQIVVGTPGRTLDHIRRGSLELDTVKMVVLDEADEMLDMGFRVDIQQILKSTPKTRQTVLFSATMSREILELTKKFQKDPKVIKVSGKNISAELVEQSYFDVEPSRKTKLLAQLLTEHNPRLSIVFCNTQRKVDDVGRDLRAHGFSSAAIHGGIRQGKRDSIMQKFRSERVNVLVATDVAARGLDVSNVEVVFNYGIPRETESYVHRIGRTGRAGRTGKAISLVSRGEFGKLRDIMRYTKTEIERKMVSNLPDLEFVDTGREKRSEEPDELVGRIHSRIKKVKRGELSRYLLMMSELVDNDRSLEDVSAALLKIVIEGDDRDRTKRPPRRRFR
ncbi:DEAD/DEAH box helicase [Candidatus Dependentiae bacterium]|nr:DEAD/DEAH box helicase [Candidatus Dependentiae bacterium]